MISTWQELPYAGPLMLYTTRDLNSSSRSDDDRFGLYRSDWVPKAAQQVVASPPGVGPNYQRFAAFTDPSFGEVLSQVYTDRKSVVQGKRVSVRVALGGRRNLK